MNKKYFLLLLILGITLPNEDLEKQDGAEPLKKIEEEKDISNEKIYDIINRNIELYNYDISISHSIPLGSNISNSFNPGGSISLIIGTPYKTPKILNRFTFNISSEIIIKNYKFKSDSEYSSNYNIFGFYLLLNPNLEKNTSMNYGFGISHINQGTNNSLVPSLKLILDYRVNFQKLYTILINNHITTENPDLRLFLNSLDLRFGLSPEVLIGFPGRSREMTLGADIYMRLNLFNL